MKLQISSFSLRWLVLALLLSSLLALPSCDFRAELGSKTLDRIDRINSLLDRGIIEVAPETRQLIRELNETVDQGVKVGFDDESLARIDRLLEIIESDPAIAIGLDEKTNATVNNIIRAFENAPGNWEKSLQEIIQTLEGASSNALHQMAQDVSSIMQEARLNSTYVAAAMGEQFRCNVDFLGSKAGATLDEFIGRSILGRIKDILIGKKSQPITPVPWVCAIIPDQVLLARAGEKLQAEKPVITISGYNFMEDNLPSAEIVDEAGATLSSSALYPFRVSAYQLQLNLQDIDFSSLPYRTRVVFHWPGIFDTNAIAIVLPDETAGPERAELTVLENDVSIHSGPDENYNLIGYADRGTIFEVKGCNGESTWWQILYEGDLAWVTDAKVERNEITVDPVPLPLPPPTARFSCSPKKLEVGAEVRCQDQSLDSPTSWNWEFSDGQTFQHSRPVVKFKEPGQYTVQLTVANDQGSDSLALSQPIEVTAFTVPAKAGFTVDTDKGLLPLTVHFTDQSEGSALTYHWEFGDGGVSNETSPTYTFQSEGAYDVRLTVSNSKGDSSSNMEITVFGPTPTPEYLQNAITLHTLTGTKYSGIGSNTRYDTGISTAQTDCGILGFAALWGDINENDTANPIYAYLQDDGGTWVLYADFHTHDDHESWFFELICIDKAASESYEIFRDVRLTADGDQDAKATIDSKFGSQSYCGVVGMAARNGDIQENDMGDILKVYARDDENDGTWELTANLRSHDSHERWELDVLCLYDDPAVLKHWTTQRLSGKTAYDTQVNADSYACGIAGFQALDGDINENDEADILVAAYTFIKDSNWWMLADFNSHHVHESWILDLLCISRPPARLEFSDSYDWSEYWVPWTPIIGG
jgi:PKD repeat protein